MKVQSISQTQFKGYDARPLKGFLMSGNPADIALELQAIGKKENFKIFYPTKNSIETVTKKNLPPKFPEYNDIWAQDKWTIVKNRLLSVDNSKISKNIKNFFNLDFDFQKQKEKISTSMEMLKSNPICIFRNEEDEDGFPITNDGFSTINKIRLQKKYHIPGGNIFIVKGDEKDELIIGANELEKFSVDEIKSMYNVDKVTILPQMDYHIDLFIRPLDKKRILIADDNKTLETLNNILTSLVKTKQKAPIEKKANYNNPIFVLKKIISEMEESLLFNPLAQTDEITEILEENNYEVIPVAGRIYNLENPTTDDISLVHQCNYMNANVLKNKNNEMVYITNYSNIDERIGLTEEIQKEISTSFQQAFVESISSYVDPEHIYFVKGKNNYLSSTMLPELQGGIHCICSEIPKQ